MMSAMTRIGLCLLCCAASLAHGESGKESLTSPQFCHKTIKDEACVLDDCTRTSREICYHGDCSDTGDCVCAPCWRGASCDEPVNNHAPIFTRTFYEEYISPDEPKGTPFMYIRATDMDEAACAESGAHRRHCPCAQVLYSLDGGDGRGGDGRGGDGDGAGHAPFAIDAHTGGISVAPEATLAPSTKHRLTAHASNPGNSQRHDTVVVVVIVSEILLGDQTVQLRRLLTAPEIKVLDGNHSLDISFLPSSEDIGVGSLTVGSRVDCVLTITIPEAVFVPDIHVEIFTEDDNKTLSVMCPPTVSPGLELEIEDTVPQQMSSQQGEENPFLVQVYNRMVSHPSGLVYPTRMDTVTFDFSNVTNLNTSMNAQDSQIVFTFSISLKEDQGIAVDERYWISAGVEYNGESKLWIGQIGFLINQVPQYASDTNITVEGPADLHKGEVEVFNVDLNVYKSVANLTVWATAGLTAKEYLLICELQLCNTGTGFCLDINKDLATFQVDMVSQNAYESVFGFGNIVNGGSPNSTSDSRISMDVVVYLRDESGLADETSHDITATADDGDKVSMATAAFTAKAGRDYLTPGKSLTIRATVFNTTNGNGQLVPGECARVRVTIEVTASTSVSPVSVSLAAQVGGTDLQINAALVNVVGNDISCLLQRRDAIEDTVNYAAGPTATIDLRGVANTGSDADGISNLIAVDFVVKSVATDPGSDGNAHMFDVSVSYAGALLTQSVSLATITDPARIAYPAVLEADPRPFTGTLELLDPADPATIAPGEVAVLALRLVVARGAQYRYVASSLTNVTGVTVVDMRVKSVGGHFAGGLLVDPVATYDPPVGRADSAELDLGMVYNFARPGNSVEADGLLIQVVVQVTEQVSESVVPIGASVLAGGNRLWVTEGNVTVSTAAAAEPFLPNGNFTVAAGSSAQVVPGSETILVHRFVIAANTSSKYVVNYTAPVPWLLVTSVNLTSVGLNLACTDKGQPTTYSGSSDTEAYTVVDLGYVCHVPIGNETAENGMLEVTLTVSTSNTSDVEVGLTPVFEAIVQVSNAQGTTKTVTQEIVFSVALPKSTFRLCCPESAYSMRPGDVERCNVTMTILDSTVSLLMELNTPFNGTAAMTLRSVEVSSGGFNVKFTTPQVVYESSGSSSQKNIAKLNFEMITNTGEHTAEAGNLVDGDNDIVVWADVQMSDGAPNANGSAHALESGVSLSHGAVVWVAYFKIAEIRDGAERPALNVSLSHNGSASTYSVGDTVVYQVDVTHAADSSAEAVNVKGHVFLPPYIQFGSMEPNYDLESNPPLIVPSNDNTGFYFTVPRMFFTDRVVFTLETTIKADYRYKLTKNWKGTTPIQVIYYMAQYNTDFYTDGQSFSEPMDYTTFDFTVPYPDVPGQTLLPVCGSPTPLGMEDGNIADCQITASFTPEPVDAAAHHARLNGPSAWKTPARAGPFLYDRWVKVDLGKRAFVTGIQTQGGSSVDADGDLGKFDILYSLDDTLYKAATPSDNKAFDHQKDAPADHDTVVSHALLIPVEARYVIVNLTAYDYVSQTKWYNALRLEILGCEISDSTATDPCPTSATPLIPPPYQRGFLADVSTDTLFVCDTVPHGKSGVRRELQASVYTFLWKKPDMQCFMMIYAEKQWTGLDPRLRNIVGLLPSTGQLFGIMGSSPDSYAASDRPYTSWYLIERGKYDAAAASADFVGSVAVPFVSEAGFNYADPDNTAGSNYAISDWKATLSGIFKGVEKVMDWNDCCQPSCSANGGLDDCS